MNESKMDDVLLTGGGIIPQKDMESLSQQGVGQLFGPGTPIQETVEYITEWVTDNRWKE
jgi:methylmalonyl-CoA mutase C-terminal domain/subunit